MKTVRNSKSRLIVLLNQNALRLFNQVNIIHVSYSAINYCFYQNKLRAQKSRDLVNLMPNVLNVKSK